MIPTPEHHFPDDTEWITQQLTRIPSAMRQTTCERYSAVYAAEQALHQGKPYDHCRARYAANTRLREFVDKVLVSLNGAVSAPDYAKGVEQEKRSFCLEEGLLGAGKGREE